MATLRICIDVDIDQAAVSKIVTLPKAELQHLLAGLFERGEKLPYVNVLTNYLSTEEGRGITDITATVID